MPTLTIFGALRALIGQKKQKASLPQLRTKDGLAAQFVQAGGKNERKEAREAKKAPLTSMTCLVDARFRG